MLIVGRAVAGMGGSGLMNGGLTIMANSISPTKRPGKITSEYFAADANCYLSIYGNHDIR
jgi:MFS family permease